jgi:hypothetical protein
MESLVTAFMVARICRLLMAKLVAAELQISIPRLLPDTYIYNPYRRCSARVKTYMPVNV